MRECVLAYQQIGFHADASLNLLKMTPKRFHRSDDDVEAYSMGKLNGSSLQEFEMHLFVCEQCRMRVVQTEQFLKLLNIATLPSRPQMNSADAEAHARFEDQRDRRKEFRVACTRLAAIRVHASKSNQAEPSIVGLLVDQSVSGAGICAHVPLELGSFIEIRTATQRFHGVVKSCTATHDQYRIGVELTYLI